MKIELNEKEWNFIKGFLKRSEMFLEIMPDKLIMFPDKVGARKMTKDISEKLGDKYENKSINKSWPI